MFGRKEYSNNLSSLASLTDRWLPPKWRSIVYLSLGFASSIAYYQSVNVVWLLIALLGFIVAAAATMKQWSVKSTLSKPRCGLETDQRLWGRDEDIQTLAYALRRHRLVFLIGQSGCGKSSLVRRGLIPALACDAQTLPVYIENWGVDCDWSPGLQTAVASALFAALTEDERTRCGLDSQFHPGKVLEVLELVKNKLNREPILLFDRLDDYRVQLGGRLIKRGRLLSRKKLIKSNRFWKQISRLLNNEKIRCLFIIPDVSSWAVEAFRFQKPVVHILEPLDSLVAEQWITEIMEPCVRNPEQGWWQLKERVLSDMEHNGRVLPIRMRRLLEGLDELRFLTIEHFDRVGGLAGLQAESINHRIEQTAARFGWRYADVLLLLNRLIARASPQSVASTATQLVDDLPQLRSYGNTVVQLMRGLASPSAEILQERVVTETGESAWRLSRDDLGDVINGLDSQRRHWQTFLNHAADRFEGSSGIWRKFSALLSPREQLRVLVARLQGALRYGSRAHFARLSALRLILNAWVLLSVFLLAALMHRLDRVESVKAAALLSEFSASQSVAISAVEKVSLWRLSNASHGVKRRFIEQTVASGPNADRFLLHANRIGVAVLGLSLEARKNFARHPLSALCYGEPTDDFRRSRACLTWLMMAEADALRIAAFITRHMDQGQRSWRELVELADAFVKLGDRVTPEWVDRVAERLVTQMEQEDRFAQELWGFADVLGRLGEGVSTELVRRGAERMIEAMERDDLSWRELRTLATALGKLGARVVADGGLGGFTERLTEKMRRGDHTTQELAAYALAVEGLGGRVPQDLVGRAVTEQHLVDTAVASEDMLVGVADAESPDQAGVLAEQLVMAIQQDERSWSERVQIARTLVGLSDQLAVDEALALAEQLVETMERNDLSVRELGALAEVLDLLSARIQAEQQGRDFAERLMLVMEQDERSAEGLHGLAKALGALRQGVPQGIIDRGSKRLVVAMERNDRSLSELVALAKGLAEFGEGLSQEFAARGLEQIVSAMEQQHRSRWEIEMLAGALGKLAKYAPVQRVEGAVDRLSTAMEREGRCAEELGALARGIGRLSAALDPVRREQMLDMLEMKLKPLANPPCEVIAQFVMEQNELADVLDVLKWPTCNAQARKQLVNRSNEIMHWISTEQSSRYDAWKFLNRIRRWGAQHKSYDVDANVPPPKGISAHAHAAWLHLW